MKGKTMSMKAYEVKIIVEVNDDDNNNLGLALEFLKLSLYDQEHVSHEQILIADIQDISQWQEVL